VNTPTLDTLRAHEARCQKLAIEQGGDWRRRFLEARTAREFLEREETLGFFLAQSWVLTASDLLAIADHQARARFEEEGGVL
jgi:hypothetical protein